MFTIRASLVTLALLAICLCSTHTSAVSRECCRRYTRGKIPCHAIKGYSIQVATELCNLNAIIFHTKKGKAACTDPALDWVMACVERLRNKAQMVHNKSSGYRGEPVERNLDPTAFVAALTALQ